MHIFFDTAPYLNIRWIVAIYGKKYTINVVISQIESWGIDFYFMLNYLLPSKKSFNINQTLLFYHTFRGKYFLLQLCKIELEIPFLFA